MFKKTNFTPVLFTPFIINWTGDMTDDLLANIQGVITDLSPLLVPIIAIGVGLIVVSAIISAIRGHN
ncbi:MAG: hypothetical protein WC495_06765 [Patescibacteria group bacterium]|jgi:hypothetical protein